MTFQNPVALLLIIPLIMILTIRKYPRRAISFPAASSLSGLPVTVTQRAAMAAPMMRRAALLLAVISLARPQIVNTETSVSSKGVDIVLALDLSTSMLAVDRSRPERKRSRLVIAKEVTREFIAKRAGDRIGLVAFAARPYPVGPLTLDHDWLSRCLDTLEPESTEDGTALGDGLLAAVNRLRSSPAESRVIVLLTDGRSNAGEITSDTAAAAARALGVKVHTIGIGSRGHAEFPIEDPLGGTIWRAIAADLDEATLQSIATTTGGRYFKADGPEGLRSIFAEIDRLEKHIIVEKRSRSRKELFTPFILAAFLLLITERTFSVTWLRGLP
jgi:Ca-activated chloride channel family protein